MSKAEKEFAFYFNFFDEDSDSETTYGFLIKEPVALYASLAAVDLHGMVKAMNAFTIDELVPKYGSQDWMLRPNYTSTAVGFTTSDHGIVDPLVLVEEWRDWFAKNGASPSTVVEAKLVTRGEHGLALYQDIKKALRNEVDRLR